MLKAKKEELQERGYKGFTLMEMLIVVAIIAVLIAIAIPVFTNQLEQSREATDKANVRSMYATLMTQYLTNADSAYSGSVKAQQTQTGWQGESGVIDQMIDGVESSIAYEAQTDTFWVHIDTSGKVVVNNTQS